MEFINLPNVRVDFVARFPKVVEADLVCKYEDIVSYIIMRKHEKFGSLLRISY